MVRGLIGQGSSAAAGSGAGASTAGSVESSVAHGGRLTAFAPPRSARPPRLDAHHLGERLGQLVQRDALRLRVERRFTEKVTLKAVISYQSAFFTVCLPSTQ